MTRGVRCRCLRLVRCRRRSEVGCGCWCGLRYGRCPVCSGGGGSLVLLNLAFRLFRAVVGGAGAVGGAGDGAVDVAGGAVVGAVGAVVSVVPLPTVQSPSP